MVIKLDDILLLRVIGGDIGFGRTANKCEYEAVLQDFDKAGIAGRRQGIEEAINVEHICDASLQ